MFEEITMVKETLNGGYSYFDKLIEKYERIVYIFIYALIRNENFSKEICQRVFVQVYNNLYKYNINHKLLNWILNIVVMECKLFIKNNENIKNENSYLNLLNIDDRCVLLLKKLNVELSFNDISEILDMSEMGVRKRYKDIIDSYKKEISVIRQN